MTTETVLTDEQRELLFILHMEDFMDGESADRAIKAIERAVLQSPEVQQMRMKAARYTWIREEMLIDQQKSMTTQSGALFVGNRLDDFIDAKIDEAMEKKE